MKLSVLLIVLICVSFSQAGFVRWMKKLFGLGKDDSEQQKIQQSWDGLRVRYPVFEGMPRTEKEAVDAGWERDRSVSCDSGEARTYEGYRYMKDEDKAAMLLFDKNGYIAGIQAGIPKSSDPSRFPNPNNRVLHTYIEEGNVMVVTAYFVEPSTICSEGRSKASFEQEGTGNMLAFQTGLNAQSLMRIPKEQSRLEDTTKFVYGACVPKMGRHYWYKNDEDVSLSEQNCDHIFPAFLLYTNDKLNGFGWGFAPNFDNSQRWEHFPVKVLDATMGKRFLCMDVKGDGSDLFTGFHVYFDNEPQDITCS